MLISVTSFMQKNVYDKVTNNIKNMTASEEGNYGVYLKINPTLRV